MKLTKLYDPSKGTMQVAGLMSDRGTNLVEIIKKELELKRSNQYPFHVAVIFTDNSQSNAKEIGRKYNIPVLVNDIKAFYTNNKRPLNDLNLRQEYDAETVKILNVFDISVAAYAGYMCIATKPLIDAFLGINVHPADLSIMNDDGKRKYTGDHAVGRALIAGETELRSSTHIVEERVDYGKILMISEPMKVILNHRLDINNAKSVEKAEKINQDRLKRIGDWVIFPRTILDVSRGKYSMDNFGNIHYEGVLLPDGLKLEK
jgi:folate-dependent phosphoribosylglycinamide formyltransferase PurN